MKKHLIAFALFIVLVCSAAAVGAAENDTNSQANATVCSVCAEEVTEAESESSVLEAENDNASDELLTSSSGDVLAASSKSQKSSKEKLKIFRTTNTAIKGKQYNMYLKDSNGKGVAGKKLNIKFNGKNYARTTDKNGRFSIGISLSKSSAPIDVTFSGDKQYKAFSKKLTVYIGKTRPITIGNSKLLTNGYLRIYLHGTKNSISKKTVKIRIAGKTLYRKTTAEGFIVLKPMLSPKYYTVLVIYGKYYLAKGFNCVKGNVKDPLKTYVRNKGVPDIDSMPANYVMGDRYATYTLLKSQYQETIKRDSYCIYLFKHVPKYTFFKTKDCPQFNHVLKRENWNVIERALNVKLVKAYKYEYWPSSITVSINGRAYTYSVVRDVQNTEYTCGPTSASVCSQALKKYRSEKYFQTKAHVTDGVNVDVLESTLDNHGFSASYYYSVDAGVSQLKKGGCALITFLPNHYVSVIDVSKDGKKVLVSNSYGDYNVGGDTKVVTGWVSLKFFKSKFAGVGLVVRLKYSLSDSTKKMAKNYYTSMGFHATRQNTNERIPNT